MGVNETRHGRKHHMCVCDCGAHREEQTANYIARKPPGKKKFFFSNSLCFLINFSSVTSVCISVSVDLRQQLHRAEGSVPDGQAAN